MLRCPVPHFPAPGTWFLALGPGSRYLTIVYMAGDEMLRLHLDKLRAFGIRTVLKAFTAAGQEAAAVRQIHR